MSEQEDSRVDSTHEASQMEDFKTADDVDNIVNPAEFINALQSTFTQMQDRFTQMMDGVLKRMDEMAERLNDLEKEVTDLVNYAGGATERDAENVPPAGDK